MSKTNYYLENIEEIANYITTHKKRPIFKTMNDKYMILRFAEDNNKRLIKLYGNTMYTRIIQHLKY